MNRCFFPNRFSVWSSALIAIFILFIESCNPEDSDKLFTLMDKDHTGIAFQNQLFEGQSLNVLNYIYFYNGGGVAIGDINNDGLPDILFTGNMVHNRLYLNKGNFTFEDITEKSGIAAQEGWCTGATMVDINGDGKLDIYICRSADANSSRRKNLLYINNGDLSFTEKAAEYGLADEGFSTQAVFFDYDKDGDLDMFLINHSLHQYTTGAVDNPGWRKEKQPAFECKLYRNDWNDQLGHGVYRDVSAQAGITSNVLTFGLGVAVSDFNNDGWPDIYVSNDFNEADYLFMNNGNGTFSEKLPEAMDQTSLYSMGSDAADYNNDGFTDLMTLDMLPEDNHTQKMHSGAENFPKFQQLFNRGFYYQYSRNMLQTNNGDGTFSETGQLAGVSNTNWSWSALFSDFDNDGNKDLLVTNGYVKDYTDMDFLKYSADEQTKGEQKDKNTAVNDFISKMPPSLNQSYVFRNNGNGRFSNMSDAWGLTRKTISSGAAYADFNNDGAMDLVVNETNAPAALYRNNSGKNDKNNYLKIKLKGSPRNREGIGAKLTLYCGATLYYQEQQPVRGFQSSVDHVLNFGIGKNAVIDSLLVIWPDDHYQVLHNLKPDQLLTLDIKDAITKWDYQNITKSEPFFKKQSDLPFVERTPDLHDFDRQPLLINYLSRQGPCMAKADVNGDGLEDIFIGGAQGQSARLFLQNKKGEFSVSRQPSIEKDSTAETGAALFFDANGDGFVDLLISASGYALSADDPALKLKLYLNDGKGHFTKQEDALPPMLISSNCLKAADIDGDGDLDLFVGGRLIPGQYPRSPGSRILLNDGKGHFTDATASVAPSLLHTGMVTDAVWVDLDKNSKPDLVMVGEWMPITVMLNFNGKLVDSSSKYIHFASTGFWSRILAVDLNRDGQPDLIVGNQGLNNQFTASEKEPLQLYYKDFDGNGIVDPVFCYYINGKAYPAASRDDLTGQLPMLKKKFITYSSYADAGIKELFSDEQLKDAGVLKAEYLSTVWLENKGAAGFEKQELPQEAQYAPVFAIDTLDVNGDGKTDLILAGNNAWTRIRFGRYRANHGIVLLGDGTGHFRTLSQAKTGLKLREDVRSILHVTEGGKTKLFVGSSENPVRSFLLKGLP